MHHFLIIGTLILILFIVVNNNTLAEATQCPIDYQIDMNRSIYDAGENVTIGAVSPEIDCTYQPTKVTLKILDSTKNLSGDKIVYQETRVVLDGTEFHYVLLQSTADYTPFRYLVEISFDNTREIIKHTGYFFVQDSTKSTLYDFQIWPHESEVLKEVSSVNIIAKICPFFPPADLGRDYVRDQKTGQIIDPGSGVLMTYYFTSPDGIAITTSEIVDLMRIANRHGPEES